MGKRHLTAGLLAGAIAVSPALAAPAMWKVSDADSAVWLFGSVHILDEDVAWRTGLLDKVMSKAERIYFETDISPEAQTKIMPLMFEMAFNRDGRLLSDIIGKKMTAQVRVAAEAMGVPMASLLTMRPWMAGMTLSMGPLSTTGYDPGLGVEATLQAELPADKLGELETLEEQMNFLAGGSEAEQIQMLQAVLDATDTANADIDALVESWAAGDPDRLGAMFAEQTAAYGDSMMGRIIDQRNENWTGQIAGMLDSNEKALLVVGAAHLAGPASVTKMLEERGFTVERVQ